TLPLSACSAEQVAAAVERAAEAFRHWRLVPAPRRGELVRRIGNLVREHKRDLAKLVCLEAGKILPEAEGEIQEWIDVCDFAVGLSRQLYGRTIASERPEHHLIEQFLPLGPVGIISAFNFPAAVWSWNAMIALVCGDTLVWKPSEQTSLTALACHQILCRAAAGLDDVPADVSSVVLGGAHVGPALAGAHRLPLVSATGSVCMVRQGTAIGGGPLGGRLLESGGDT